ncbi:60S ribosomal protein L7-2-like [Macadamia integrifolia]|uniref:60S ribosomal protein L7-2-like n=1 Tax=Macadamia integrifolia TaxID=60698 RepID=UPI001C4EA008|nr:60S ribosomal protein L7-2-like [Macadamia integrifolia]XP_042507248.1 60S ribosomal protein L7-2-like [Macadamia integrifolia]
MADEEQKPLPYVQETVLKKRKNNEEWAIRRKEQLGQKKLRSKENRKLIFKRAEQYIKEYRNQELDLVQMKHRGKRQKSSPVALKSNLLFIIRICGTNDMHPKTRKILHYLRLKRILAGVFVKANDGIMDMLRRVEPYVTYGYPNLKSVKELVYKKGSGKIGGQRVPLTDNNIIEQALGKHGIICLEDIVHEIATVGPHFKEVVSFLWPFKLNKTEDVQGKKKMYKDGGDAGNREDHINDLISKMN